jgi:hypothetical protein
MLERVQDKNSSKLRSRGMTGLEQLIQKDPKVITKGNFLEIIRSLTDNSPMVRESTPKHRLNSLRVSTVSASPGFATYPPHSGPRCLERAKEESDQAPERYLQWPILHGAKASNHRSFTFALAR